MGKDNLKESKLQKIAFLPFAIDVPGLCDRFSRFHSEAPKNKWLPHFLGKTHTKMSIF